MPVEAAVGTSPEAGAAAAQTRGTASLATEQAQAVAEAQAIVKPSPELPISEYEGIIQESGRNNDYTLVVGGPGTGKTTKTPQYIWKIKSPGDKIIVTEPRQINTSALAARVAEEMGLTLGREVGFQHGADSNYSKDTDLLFNTEGTLIQKMQDDPLLSDITHVMVDEIHVRSKDTELLLYLLKQAQAQRKEKEMKPLKIIATSATVDREELSKYFGGIKPIEIEGRNYPVDTRFSDHAIPSDQMAFEAARLVGSIFKEEKQKIKRVTIATNFAETGLTLNSDIVIYVAGVGDIQKTREEIEKLNLDGLKITSLHANSSAEEKAEVASQANGANGVRYVINTGEEFEESVDPVTGLTYVKRIKQSRANAAQRAGRAGRTAPGVCHSLFTKEDHESRQEYPTPEIKRTDITDALLYAKKFGIDLSKAEFLSAPLDPERIAYAAETLDTLGALNSDGTLNKIGERMVALPTEFHLARMIAEAENAGRGVDEACTIAALADTFRFQIDQSLSRFKRNPNSDFLTYLALWREFEHAEKKEEWAKNNGLSYQMLVRAGKAREKLLERANRKDSKAATEEEVEQLVAVGFSDKLMKYNKDRKSYTLERQNVANMNLVIGSSSVLNRKTPEYIISAKNSPIEEGQNRVYVSMVQRVKPEWLAESLAPAA